MCQNNDPGTECKTKLVNRRHFLKLITAVTSGLGLSQAFSAVPNQLPKPQNAISSDEAFERLLKGNERYVTGTMKPHDFISERPTLIRAQNPFAGILSCSDSRVAPEYAFDTGRGDLFVCRVAGNFASKETVASFEYAIAALQIPLLVVLGHRGCGAIEATVDAVKHEKSFPGHIPSIITALRPAVELTIKESNENLVDNSIRKNVVLNVKLLKVATPIISKAVEEKKVRIIGGVYNLDTGRVDIFA